MIYRIHLRRPQQKGTQALRCRTSSETIIVSAAPGASGSQVGSRFPRFSSRAALRSSLG
jgi:hypothetical protein